MSDYSWFNSAVGKLGFHGIFPFLTEYFITEKMINMSVGLSFTGSRDSYNDTLKKYQRWTDVKDSDNIDPYRATDTSWTPSCANIGRI